MWRSADGKSYTPGASLEKFSPAQPLEFSCREESIRFYSQGKVISTDKLETSTPVNIYSPAEGVKITVHKTEPIYMSDDFMRRVIGKDDSWSIVAGQWRTQTQNDVAASPNPFICRGTAIAEDGMLIAGYPFWNNYTLSVALKPGDFPQAGLVFSYRNPQDYCKAMLLKENGHSYVAMVKSYQNQMTVLAKREMFYPTDRWFKFAVKVYEDRPILVSIDGVEVLSCPDELNKFGKVGLLVRQADCLFDDFLATSTLAWDDDKDSLHLVGKKSRAYSHKQKFLEDDRDVRLFRWAKETDAWPLMTVTYDKAAYAGRYYRFPFFGDFSFFTQNTSDDTLFVIRDLEGQTLKMQPLPKHKPSTLSRRADKLFLNGQELATGPPPNALLVGLHFREGTLRQDTFPEIRSNSIQHELFEDATVDWYPVYGYWENTSRWGCAPKWKFFSGTSLDAAIQFSKRTFDGDQIHEVNYALKDVIGDHRVTLECDNWEPRQHRYIRSDVNFSFLTDGKDVFSGYTFMYGGHANQASYLYRGRELVSTNEEVRFPRPEKYYLHGKLEPNVFDQHLFWRRFRFERFGKRIRVLFEDKVVFDYTETEADMPDGGHIAIWTQRNGIIYARLDSVAQNITMAAEKYVFQKPGEEVRSWRAMNANQVCLEPLEEGLVRVTNRFGGGEFAVLYKDILNRPVNLLDTPKMKLRLNIPEGVAVNLHLRVGGEDIIYALTAPTEKTFAVLNNGTRPDLSFIFDYWHLFGTKPLQPPLIGGIPQAAITDEITIDLLAEMKKRFPDKQTYRLESIIIGNTSQLDYLMAGLSGNAAGASYTLGIPTFTK
ncbi:MAG: hypothetical protein JXA52_08260 [Planctomycetes bacterium]|nr:hypothetical protein [Planctomycetota bacterium]